MFALPLTVQSSRPLCVNANAYGTQFHLSVAVKAAVGLQLGSTYVKCKLMLTSKCQANPYGFATVC